MYRKYMFLEALEWWNVRVFFFFYLPCIGCRVYYIESLVLMVPFLPFHRMTCKLEFLIITPWKGFTCLKPIQITFVVLLCIPRSLSY